MQLRRFEPIKGFIIDENDNVVIDPRAADKDLSYSWYGIGGGGELTVFVREGHLSATLTTLRRTYSLGNDAKRGLIMRELDPRFAPPDIVPSKPRELPAVAIEEAPAEGASKQLDVIDVLVVYSQAALNPPSGAITVDALRTRVGEALTQANLAIDNSSITSVRLRNALEQSGNPSVALPLNTYATNAATGNEINGHMCPADVPLEFCRYFGHRIWMRTSAEIANLRNQHQADLVIMVVRDSPAACGIAYIQQPDCDEAADFGEDPPVPLCNVRAGYNNFAFAAVSYECMTAFQAFAHEGGHQFGMEHDPANGSPVAAASFPWSYGHFVDGLGETIMSVNSLLSAQQSQCQSGCPRQLQFSNPTVGFIANPLVPSGLAGRYNARTMTTFSAAMANFRGPPIDDRIFRSSMELLPVPD